MQQWISGDRRSGSVRTANSSGNVTQERLTRIGTWFSLGLGLAQVAMPGQMARMIGVRDTDDARMMMRLVGVRELVAGLGLISGRWSGGWFSFRTGGDLMDLTLLGAAFSGRGSDTGRLSMATAMVLGATAMDVLGALELGGRSDRPYSPTTPGRLTPTTKTIVVNREPADVYQFWLRFDQFPRFMRHLKQVSVRKDGTSHWEAYGPGGQLYGWDAEVVENRPNELIAWRSRPGGDVENEGSVRFERAPGGRGTLVRVNLRYAPPAGAVGSAIASLLGREPGQEVQEDLRRFKQVIETGEVMLSDANIHRSAHPARPDDASFRLPKPVPGAGPVESAHDDGGTNRGWPEPDDRPAHRADADTTAGEPVRGGTR